MTRRRTVELMVDFASGSVSLLAAECSGPPHLLGPWGSAGTGRCEWPPHDTVPGRPPSHLRLITLESEPTGSASLERRRPWRIDRRPPGLAFGEHLRMNARTGLFDFGFAEFDVLLGDRIVFLLDQFVGHRARILARHIVKAGVRAGH